MKQIVFTLFLFLTLANFSWGQKYTELTLRKKLDELAVKHTGLNNTLQLNISGLQLAELVNSVALENNLNISVDPKLNQIVSYNFFDASVIDMLVFLYKDFDIEYEFIGSIISISGREVIQPKVKPAPKTNITYNPSNRFLSMDVKNDTLWNVVNELTKQSGSNFVVDPEVRNNVVNAYFLNRPMEEVLQMFVESNDLLIEKSDSTNYYSFLENKEKNETGSRTNNRNANRGNYKNNSKPGQLVISKNNSGRIDVKASDADLSDVIHGVADETGILYVLDPTITGKVDLDIKDMRFDDFIELVLEGTKYSVNKHDQVYVVGEHKTEGIAVTELIRLENRTIESVQTSLPGELTNDLTIKEFPELNALIVSGSKRKIDALRLFIAEIDMVVPMVQIDVMLVFSDRSSTVKTGISAGIGDKPTTTSGSVFPELDITMGANSINNILNAINGFGLVNLGQVTSDFYLSLQALEDNNVISIESTPKISVLNGHEGEMSIGEETSYQQKKVTVQNSVTNSGVIQDQVWKQISADLTVTITPFVSADEHVTLTITVTQNDFSGQSAPGAPPNMTKQTFTSIVRVKNGEVILLGGLDKKRKVDTGSGVPLLSRIPILKWFFSSKEKTKEKSKLHVILRPTVTY